jgi:hypothetical protein
VAAVIYAGVLTGLLLIMAYFKFQRYGTDFGH